MPTIKQLNQTIEEGSSLKYIAQAYTEVSSARLKKIRAGIEKNRGFFREITGVLHVIQEAAAKKHVAAKKQTKGTVSIIITSNYRFFGSLENRLLRYYLVNTSKYPTDRIVIGKSGQTYLRNMGYFHSHHSLTFEKDLPNDKELKGLSDLLSDYRQVLVYYSQMKSVMVQNPTITDISQSAAELEQKQQTGQIDYIFEPEIGKMLEFFQGQIISLLLEQAILESELARNAARLISMDQAQINADEFIHQQKLLLAGGRRTQVNNQLLETAASLLKWRKENK